MGLSGKIAWASWAITAILIFVLVLGAYIFYNINSSDYEKGCADQNTKEKIKTSWQFSLGFIIVVSILLFIVLLIAIISSVVSLKQKDFSAIGTTAGQIFGTGTLTNDQIEAIKIYKKAFGKN